MNNRSPMGLSVNVRLQHFDKRRQRPDVALAWWIARTFPTFRKRAEGYAFKRHRLGAKLSDETTKNIIVTSGVLGQAGLFGGINGEDAFIYQALGTSAAAEDAAQTALVAETAASGLARKGRDAVSIVNAGVDTATLRNGGTLFVNNTATPVTIEESAEFNGKGTMYARLLTGTKELLPGHGLIVTHDNKFTYTPAP